LAARRAQQKLICIKAHMRVMTYLSLMQDIVSLLSALAEPTRLAALRLLWDGEEHCVCELMKKIDASQSRMSRHMAALKAIGLVVDRRDAQWVRYRRNPALSPEVAAIVDAVMTALPKAARRAA
jgi:ArsR family transcriptional regulator, arsenate/arsenite/antimonite-responsive transcriptional repressor